MEIFLALLYPMAATVALAALFKARVTWWEYLLPTGSCLVLICGAKALTERLQVSDTEFLTSYITQAEYDEPWDESVPCRHPKYRTETRTRVVNGKTETYTETVQDGYEHAYDVDYHPAAYRAYDSNGSAHSVGRDTFDRLALKFGNRLFVDLHRSYHSIDGDRYVTSFPGDDDRMEVCSTRQTYENRVIAGRSVFKFKEVDPKGCGCLEYPEISGWHQRVVLGDAGPTGLAGEAKLQRLNARLGRQKQVKVFVVVYKNQPISAALDQEAYWQGGNKNELIACVGVDDKYHVDWAYVISWTPNTQFKAEVADHLADQKTLDLYEFADWLGPQVQKKWQRKHFKEFSYITVDPPLWAVALTHGLTLLLCGGVCVWVVINEPKPRTA